MALQIKRRAEGPEWRDGLGYTHIPAVELSPEEAAQVYLNYRETGGSPIRVWEKIIKNLGGPASLAVIEQEQRLV